LRHASELLHESWRKRRTSRFHLQLGLNVDA
jgi:hypothetical protein